MKIDLNILNKHLFAWVLVFATQSYHAQIVGCNLQIPPFMTNGVDVSHSLGQNTFVFNEGLDWLICSDSNYTIPFDIPVVSLGGCSGCSDLWNPFTYTLHFSKPISSLDVILYVGGTGFLAIDYGAENFVFETSGADIGIQSIFACNEFIDGDTLFLGYNTIFEYGDGIFTLDFDCPILSLTITGKGGGAGSGFLVCSNSLTTPDLWGRISGDTLITSNQDSIFFNAFGRVAPYTFSYTVNGGAAQTLVSNTPQAWLPAPASNGTYTYELLQVKDGNDSVAVIGCNSSYVAVVSLASTAELEFETVNFSLSPNPAKEVLYISESVNLAENTAVQLTDMEGRIVLETKYEQGEALDISGLKSGLYFLRIESEKGWVAKRFVKL